MLYCWYYKLCYTNLLYYTILFYTKLYYAFRVYSRAEGLREHRKRKRITRDQGPRISEIANGCHRVSVLDVGCMERRDFQSFWVSQASVIIELTVNPRKLEHAFRMICARIQ